MKPHSLILKWNIFIDIENLITTEGIYFTILSAQYIFYYFSAKYVYMVSHSGVSHRVFLIQN